YPKYTDLTFDTSIQPNKFCDKCKKILKIILNRSKDLIFLLWYNFPVVIPFIQISLLKTYILKFISCISVLSLSRFIFTLPSVLKTSWKINDFAELTAKSKSNMECAPASRLRQLPPKKPSSKSQSDFSTTGSSDCKFKLFHVSDNLQPCIKKFLPDACENELTIGKCLIFRLYVNFCSNDQNFWLFSKNFFTSLHSCIHPGANKA
ncbi:hypothetical protein BpHYR1_004222, partial [Brachionus plicatilis]